MTVGLTAKQAEEIGKQIVKGFMDGIGAKESEVEDMATLYVYRYDLKKKIMQANEKDVKETDKQYSVFEKHDTIPFLDKGKMLKSEIGVVNLGVDRLTVVFLEQNGLKARQAFLDWLKGKHFYHTMEADKYQSCIEHLRGLQREEHNWIK